MTDQGTVLVTGGASGIGRAIVEAALAEGWRAVVADLDPERLERCRAELEPMGERVRFERLDVADEGAVAACVARCEAEFGPLNGLVSSAGIGRDVAALDTGTALLRRMLEVNLVGAFVAAREAARVMRGRGAGSIVNIASVSGILGSQGRAAYGASKGGLITLTRVLAVEWAPLGLRVNAIAPGPIETPLVREMHTAEARRGWLATVPQRRYGSPAEVAGAAMFLLDPARSSFVTGQTLCVDGGFTIAGLMPAAESNEAI